MFSVESPACHQAGKRGVAVAASGRRRRDCTSRPADALPGSTQSPPAPWRWASLPAWSRHPAVRRVRPVRDGRRQLLPGALRPGSSWDDHHHRPGIRRGSRLVGPLDHLVFPSRISQMEEHYWPDHVHDVLAGAQDLGSSTPFGAHLVNVLLYMVNVLLVWRLLAMPCRAGRLGRGRGVRGPSHACRFGGLGHRTQGSALGSFLPGVCVVLDPFRGRVGRRPGQVFRSSIFHSITHGTLPGGAGAVRVRRCCRSRRWSPCRSHSRSGSGGRMLE